MTNIPDLVAHLRAVRKATRRYYPDPHEADAFLYNAREYLDMLKYFEG